MLKVTFSVSLVKTVSYKRILSLCVRSLDSEVSGAGAVVGVGGPKSGGVLILWLAFSCSHLD